MFNKNIKIIMTKLKSGRNGPVIKKTGKKITNNDDKYKAL